MLILLKIRYKHARIKDSNLLKPVVTGLEIKGQLIWGQMGPINPWTLLHRYQNKHFTCWPARRLTSRSDWTCHKLSIKLGSYTQNGHSLELGGRHFKNNKTKKKERKRKSTFHWFTLFKVPSWNQTLAFSKWKKNYKTSKHKGSQITASLYTKNLQIYLF